MGRTDLQEHSASNLEQPMLNTCTWHVLTQCAEQHWTNRTAAQEASVDSQELKLTEGAMSTLHEQPEAMRVAETRQHCFYSGKVKESIRQDILRSIMQLLAKDGLVMARTEHTI